MLTQHEAIASLVPGVLGQLKGKPSLWLFTLRRGTINLLFGVADAYVDSFATLDKSVQAALAQQKGPTVLQIAIDPTEYH